MPHKLGLSQFPNCCGIYILTPFYKNPFKETMEQYRAYYSESQCREFGYTQAWIDQRNKANESEDVEEYKARITSEIQKYVKGHKNKKSYFLAVLNEEEYKSLHDVLLNEGFEVLVPLNKNPTGSWIVTYILHLLPRTSDNQKPVKSILKQKA